MRLRLRRQPPPTPSSSPTRSTTSSRSILPKASSSPATTLLENVYDRLIRILPAHNFELEPGLAESWSVADDGKTYTFKIRDGVKFHSGNPVTAEDAAWSLQRAVKLNKTPAFILTQFGFTPENVDQMIKANGNAVQITHRQGLCADRSSTTS